MYKSLLSDLSRVLLFPKDINYAGSLNTLHKKLLVELGEKYKPLDHFEFNTELMNFYRSLKDKYSLNLLTSDVIHHQPDIGMHLGVVFKNVFSANELGLKKKDPDIYLFICKKINTNPTNVIYIDDQIENVNAALAAGMKALLYENDNKKTITELSALLAP